MERYNETLSRELEDFENEMRITVYWLESARGIAYDLKLICDKIESESIEEYEEFQKIERRIRAAKDVMKENGDENEIITAIYMVLEKTCKDLKQYWEENYAEK